MIPLTGEQILALVHDLGGCLILAIVFVWMELSEHRRLAKAFDALRMELVAHRPAEQKKES